jgi:hypothetical protein
VIGNGGHSLPVYRLPYSLLVYWVFHTVFFIWNFSFNNVAQDSIGEGVRTLGINPAGDMLSDNARLTWVFSGHPL